MKDLTRPQQILKKYELIQSKPETIAIIKMNKDLISVAEVEIAHNDFKSERLQGKVVSEKKWQKLVQ